MAADLADTELAAIRVARSGWHCVQAAPERSSSPALLVSCRADGLGIDAAIDLGMAVGSAAGAVLALRDVRSIAVLNGVEKS